MLESYLERLFGQKIDAIAAGRTDAGVHALGQLVTFNTQSTIPPVGFMYGLQDRLPEDIVIRASVERPYGYSARFDAIRKRYRYVIHHAPQPLPWLRDYAWWYRRSLDEEAMHAATEVLLGTHDFRCFESKWPNKLSSVRTIDELRLWRTTGWTPWATTPEAHPAGEYLMLDIVADGFLYNMVRSIMGTLVHVGRGRWTPLELRQILETGTRRHAGDTAPAQGLYLVEINAPVDEARISSRLERYHQKLAENAAAAELNEDEVDPDA